MIRYFGPKVYLAQDKQIVTAALSLFIPAVHLRGVCDKVIAQRQAQSSSFTCAVFFIRCTKNIVESIEQHSSSLLRSELSLCYQQRTT
jgi:hypothetical protein